MFGLLLLAFLVVPLVELYVIIQVAGSIGTLETIGLLILVSIAGAVLVRTQGLLVLRRIQQQLGAGRVPGKEMVDGALILFAGALMLTPGFVTDALGLVLLFPLTRIPIRSLLMRRFRGRIQTFGVTGSGPGGFGPPGHGPARDRGPVIDVDDAADPPTGSEGRDGLPQ